MKPDNYNIPGYQFYLVKPKQANIGREEDFISRKSKIHEDLEKSRSMNYSLIPFEEVDGLTIKDLDSIIHGEIFLACYINIPSLHEFRYHSKIFYYLLPDNSLSKKRYEDMAIDEFVTEQMKEKYKSLSKAERRVYDCFLTRYGSEEFVKQKH